MTLLHTSTPDTLRRRALRLEYLTIGWNAIEAVVAVAAGVAAGSIALVGFGFDSSIEVLAASTVVWQFRAELRGDIDEERERRVLKLIAVTFFALAAYVCVEAIRDVLVDDKAEPSPVGIILACVSLAVMPTLAWLKRGTGRALKSATLIADSAETFLCAWLSAVLLIGLVLNATIGWWWADPLAALGVAVLALREGIEAWRGERGDEAPGHGEFALHHDLRRRRRHDQQLRLPRVPVRTSVPRHFTVPLRVLNDGVRTFLARERKLVRASARTAACGRCSPVGSSVQNCRTWRPRLPVWRSTVTAEGKLPVRCR